MSGEFDKAYSSTIPAVVTHEAAMTVKAMEERLPLSPSEQKIVDGLKGMDLFGESDFPISDPLNYGRPRERKPSVQFTYSEEAPGPGKKFDGEKLKVNLLPAKALQAVFEHGADTSSERGNSNADQLYDEVLDHLTAYLARGEVSELARAAGWCLAMLDPVSKHLLPGFSLLTVAKVLEFGARKYGENNWQNVENGVKRYTAAALRHLFAWSAGEELDPESDLPHLAHAACSLLFTLHLVAGKIQ